MGHHIPNFVFALSETILLTELPKSWKIPKFTMFLGDTNKSSFNHIDQYQADARDLANNENLKMKYFLNSLTKNAFKWFTTLPPKFYM